MLTSKDLYEALTAFHKPEEAGKVDIKTLRFVLYLRRAAGASISHFLTVTLPKDDH